MSAAGRLPNSPPASSNIDTERRRVCRATRLPSARASFPPRIAGDPNDSVAQLRGSAADAKLRSVSAAIDSSQRVGFMARALASTYNATTRFFQPPFWRGSITTPVRIRNCTPRENTWQRRRAAVAAGAMMAYEHACFNRHPRWSASRVWIERLTQLGKPASQGSAADRPLRSQPFPQWPSAGKR